MVVERGPEPMGEKGRGYGLARRYHYSQFQRRVRRRADGRKTGLRTGRRQVIARWIGDGRSGHNGGELAPSRCKASKS
jgi:hypothetical protein